MSAPKHTPGPWGFRLEAVRTVIFHKAEFGEKALAVGAGSYPAHVANARLIAAAPDLLEASRLALNALVIASRQLTEDHKMVLKGQGWAAQDIASLRAAIAKATGEEGQ